MPPGTTIGTVMIDELKEKSELSQKLIRCWVIGRDGRKTDRFVEIENFKLWSYMMFHKHGLRIRDLSLWLWVKDADFKAREEFYERAAESMEVDKLVLFLFDEENGFSHILHRYVPTMETKRQQELLLSHMSPDLVTAGNYELTAVQGFCVRNEIKNLEKIVLGLSNKDERLWYRAK